MYIYICTYNIYIYIHIPVSHPTLPWDIHVVTCQEAHCRNIEWDLISYTAALGAHDHLALHGRFWLCKSEGTSKGLSENGV